MSAPGDLPVETRVVDQHHGIGPFIAEEIVSLTRAARESFIEEGCSITAVVVNRVPAALRDAVQAELCEGLQDGQLLYALPEHPTLGRPTLEEVVHHLRARRVQGADGWQKNEVLATKIAAMTVDHYLDHLVEGCLVITPGDRSDVILASWASVHSEVSPTIVGMVLTGGLDPAPQVIQVLEGLKRSAVPLFAISDDTYATALKASQVHAKLSPDNERNAILIRDERQERILMIQIAGALARRIVCYVRPEARVERGGRCGIILFGSRVDLYLPPAVAIRVRAGDRLRAGESVIGAYA